MRGTVVLVAGLVVGVGACGSDDSGGNTGGGTSTGGSGGTGAAGTGAAGGQGGSAAGGATGGGAGAGGSSGASGSAGSAGSGGSAGSAGSSGSAGSGGSAGAACTLPGKKLGSCTITAVKNCTQYHEPTFTEQGVIDGCKSPGQVYSATGCDHSDQNFQACCVIPNNPTSSYICYYFGNAKTNETICKAQGGVWCT